MVMIKQESVLPFPLKFDCSPSSTLSVHSIIIAHDGRIFVGQILPALNVARWDDTQREDRQGSFSPQEVRTRAGGCQIAMLVRWKIRRA